MRRRLQAARDQLSTVLARRAAVSAGRADRLGSLALVQPQGSWLQLDHHSPWPLPEEARDGWWPGLPYLLQDLRPHGYLGRQVARAWHREFALSADPNEWNDLDVLHGLSRQGVDGSGNLIVGDVAYQRWQAQRRAPARPASFRSSRRCARCRAAPRRMCW